MPPRVVDRSRKVSDWPRGSPAGRRPAPARLRSPSWYLKSTMSTIAADCRRRPAACAGRAGRVGRRRGCRSPRRCPWVRLPGLVDPLLEGVLARPAVGHVGDHDPHRLPPRRALGVVGGARRRARRPCAASPASPAACPSSPRPTTPRRRARSTSPPSGTGGRCRRGASCSASRLARRSRTGLRPALRRTPQVRVQAARVEVARGGDAARPALSTTHSFFGPAAVGFGASSG